MPYTASLVIVYVKDTLRSAPFYRDLLGLPVQELSPHWAAFNAGGITLALHPHPSIPTVRDVARPWVVFGVDDPFAEHARLQAKGVVFTKAPYEVTGDAQNAGMSADFEDPDGNQYSIFGMVPRAKLPAGSPSACAPPPHA